MGLRRWWGRRSGEWIHHTQNERVFGPIVQTVVLKEEPIPEDHDDGSMKVAGKTKR